MRNPKLEKKLPMVLDENEITRLLEAPAEDNVFDRRDRAMLEAFNRELGYKKCKTFDIEAELKKTEGTPEPIPAKTKQ